MTFLSGASFLMISSKVSDVPSTSTPRISDKGKTHSRHTFLLNGLFHLRVSSLRSSFFLFLFPKMAS
jgi:hypothetical protein